MIADLIRTLFLLLVMAAMIYQARRARGFPHKRLAFSITAGAFGVLALQRLLPLIGIDLGLALSIALSSLAIGLMVGGVVLLVLAWRSGEMAVQVQQAQEKIDEERERRRRRSRD